MMEDFEDDAELSPLMSLVGSGGSSSLSETLMQRAKETAPKRSDILAKRSALMSAYKKLIDAQKYQEPSFNLPDRIDAATQLGMSNRGTVSAIGKGAANKLAAMMDLYKMQRAASENQARTGLAAQAADLEQTNSDRGAELEYLKTAASNDYRNDMMNLRMLLAMNKNKGIRTQPNANLAKELGVPVSNVNPYEGLDTTGARQLRLMQEKKLEKAQEAAQNVEKEVADVERFADINKNVDTGGLMGQIPLRGWFDSDFAELQAIAADLSRKQRQPGEGSSSDFDARMFLRAVPSPNKPYEANLNLANAYKTHKQNQKDKVDFMESYLSANGHLKGFEREWKKYLNANPIFDPASPRKPMLNSKRQSWQEFFSEQYTPKEAKKASAAIDIDPEDLKYMTPEERALFEGN